MVQTGNPEGSFLDKPRAKPDSLEAPPNKIDEFERRFRWRRPRPRPGSCRRHPNDPNTIVPGLPCPPGTYARLVFLCRGDSFHF